MTASILISMAQQFALENILTVEEAKTSRAYVEMLMRRIEAEFSEDLQIEFRNGTADLEHRAD